MGDDKIASAFSRKEGKLITDQTRQAYERMYDKTMQQDIKIADEVSSKLNSNMKTLKEDLKVVGDKSVLELTNHGETKTFEVEKLENGQFRYTVDYHDGNGPQEMPEDTFQKQMFPCLKQDYMQYEKIEGGIVPISDDLALLMVPADADKSSANQFQDGDAKMNFYKLDLNTGEKVQVTKEEIQKLMQDHKVTKETIDKFFCNCRKKAAQLAKSVAHGVTRVGRSAVGTVKQEFNKAMQAAGELGRM